MLFLIISPCINAQEKTNNENKKIVVLGSSVAAGWVTNYAEQYDFKNGYAYRLERYLSDKGFTIINKSIPGNNTKDALNRFKEDVLPENPDYLFIGLSMSNEGLETEDPDSVYQSFKSGILAIINECEANNIYPILGLCYANDNFTPDQYEYLKNMNIEMNSFNYPAVNFLGAFEDGNGHLPDPFKFDPNHPDNRGHEEFYLAFVPDLFQSIEDGKSIPEYIQHNSSISLGSKEKTQNLNFYPAENMHSFSFGFNFRTKKENQLAQVITKNNKIEIGINQAGELVWSDKTIQVKGIKQDKKAWNSIMITHRHLAKQIQVYINAELVAEFNEQIEPAVFKLGPSKGSCEYNNLLVYRAALNKNEISILPDQLLHGSLVCYAPFKDGEITNLAQTKNKLHADLENESVLLKNSLKKIETASINRKKEPVFAEKKVVNLTPEELKKFAGKYEIAKEDYFVIEVENDKIYFVDRGRKGEILAESENKFFIKYPGELTFTFTISENGKVESMIANFNGHQIPATKVIE